MKLKKRSVLLCALLVVGLSVFFFRNAASGNSNLNEQEEKIMQWGELAQIKEEPAAESNDIIIEGNQAQIAELDLTQIVAERTEVLDETEEEATAFALTYLLEKEAIYFLAIDNGYDCTQQEVDEALAALRVDFEEADNYRDFLVYLEGLDQTPDAYWAAMQTDDGYRKDLVIGKYLDDEMASFMSANGFQMKDPDFYAAWNPYLETLKAQAVEQENYRVLDPAHQDLDEVIQDAGTTVPTR